MRRRGFLHLAGAAGALAVAGCVSDGDPDDGGPDDEDPGRRDTETTDAATRESDDDDEPPADAGEEDGDGEPDEVSGEHEYSHPGAAVEAFIVAWQDGDVDAANALLYEGGELEPIDESAEEMVEDAPGIEEMESPDVDGETATVETLLALPEEGDPHPITFELTQVDGAWLIVDLVSEFEQVAPQVAFDIEFDDGGARISHVGGDAVSADELFVRGDGLGETGAWHELVDDVDAEEDVTAGQSITIEVEDEYTIDLVWEGDEHSAVLYSQSGARERVSDEPPDVDSHLADVDNYDGSIEDFTGEEEVVVETGATHDGDDPFFFDPPAVRVDEGTTVVWEWAGEGGAHNVAHVGGAFESDIEDAEGETFSHTFEESGTYLYVCQPHRALGMKGAVVVE